MSLEKVQPDASQTNLVFSPSPTQTNLTKEQLSEKRFTSYEAKSLRDNFLKRTNPNYLHISTYYDDIIERLRQSRDQKLLSLSSEASQRLSKNETSIYQRLGNKNSNSNNTDSLLRDMYVENINNKSQTEYQSKYLLAKSEIDKIFGLVKQAEQGLLGCSTNQSSDEDLQEEYYIKAVIHNCLPRNLIIKGEKMQKFADDIKYSDIEAVEFTFISLKAAKIINERFTGLKKLKIQSLQDSRFSNTSAYSSYSGLNLNAQNETKVLKELSKNKKLEQVEFATQPNVGAEVYVDFVSSMSSGNELILKNYMKTGVVLNEIIRRKKNYQSIKLQGTSNQSCLQKQTLQFLYKSIPNLKSLSIQHPGSIENSQFEVISKFKNLEELKLINRDYQSSPIDIYNYNYDELGSFGLQSLLQAKTDKPEAHFLTFLLKAFPRMRTFHFNYKPLPSGAIEIILNIIPNVEELAVYMFSNPTIAEFEFLSQFKKLKKLMIKVAMVPANALEVLKNAKFQLTYLFINMSSSSSKIERQRNQRRQLNAQRRVQRQRQQQRVVQNVFNRAHGIFDPTADDNNQQQEKVLPQLIFSPFLRNQTSLQHVKMENKLSDKIAQDLSYLSNLTILETNTASDSTAFDGQTRGPITGSAYFYLSKLSKLEKLVTQSNGNTIPQFSKAYFKFIRNVRKIQVVSQQAQLLDERVLRNMKIMNRVDKVDFNNRRQLIQAYRPQRRDFPGIQYEQ